MIFYSLSSNNNVFLMLIIALLTMTSCEEEFTPPVVEGADAIVVEGYIEAGDRPTPPYVVLTKSFPFFSKLSQDDLNNSFVRGAEVVISDGEKEVTLTEICLDEIPDEFKEQVGAFLGISTDSLGFNFCAYIDINSSMPGEEGKTYTLSIKTADNQLLTASTSIPFAIPLDTIFFQPPPGEESDTLAQLIIRLTDPANEANFYRYYTQVDDGPLARPFDSVTDDELFDGQVFEFPLAKAEPFDGDFDQVTFGLFRLETQATIKWMTINEEHFNFWNTLEFSRANQGPFSSYTRIEHNIEGGLGIWGGIAARYYEREVGF